MSKLNQPSFLDRIDHLFSHKLSIETVIRRRLSKKVALILFLILTLLLILLTVLAYYYYPQFYWDVEFSREIQEERNSLLDQLMKAVSIFGYPNVSVPMVVISSLSFYLLSYKREALFCLLTFSGGIISSILKEIITRPRPTDKIVFVMIKHTSWSFPSGHVTHYVVFFGFIIIAVLPMRKIPITIRISIIAFSQLLILLVPVSRVYLGAHWLTDVIGGFILGMILLGIQLYFYFKNSGSDIKKINN